MEIPWQLITATFLASLVILCSFQLAAWNIAPWEDVFTVFLIIMSGVGFLTTGVYYGQARAYREALKLVKKGGEDER